MQQSNGVRAITDTFGIKKGTWTARLVAAATCVPFLALAGGCGSGSGSRAITSVAAAPVVPTPGSPTPTPTAAPTEPAPFTPPATPTAPSAGVAALPSLAPPPFTIPSSPPGAAPGVPPTRAAKTRQTATDPFFFQTQTDLGNDVYYSPDFGYYYLGFYFGGQRYIYKYGFGYLYYYGSDGADGDYFYDFTARDTLYTSDRIYDYDQVTYFYSFNKRTYLFYYEDLDDRNARTFYDFSARNFITY